MSVSVQKNGNTNQDKGNLVLGVDTGESKIILIVNFNCDKSH